MSAPIAVPENQLADRVEDGQVMAYNYFVGPQRPQSPPYVTSLPPGQYPTYSNPPSASGYPYGAYFLNGAQLPVNAQFPPAVQPPPNIYAFSQDGNPIISTYNPSSESTIPAQIPTGVTYIQNFPGYSHYQQPVPHLRSATQTPLPHQQFGITSIGTQPQAEPVPIKPLTLVIGIDFGTTFSGVAFTDTNTLPISTTGAINVPPESYIRLCQRWPNCGNAATSQVPTEISYHTEDNAGGGTSLITANLGRTKPNFSWGTDIPATREKLKWFKLALEHPDELIRAKYRLPDNVSIMDVAEDFLTALHQHTLEQIRLEVSEKAFKNATIEYVVTVPAVWSELAMRRTEEAAKRAGLGEGPIKLLPELSLVSKGLRLMPEPEAAALYLLRQQHMNPNQRQVSQGETMLVCDAGGGTVDLITYYIESLHPLKVREAAVGTGDLCGSTFIDRNFATYFEERMGPVAYAELRASQRQAVVKNFELVKCAFSDAPNHPRFHVQVPGVADLPDAGIIGGEFELSREKMRELFEPVVNKVLELIAGQVAQIAGDGGRVDVILLVGGFGESPYLFQRISEWAIQGRTVVLQPGGSSAAIVKGACLRGIESSLMQAHIQATSKNAMSPQGGNMIPACLPQYISITRRARKNYGILHSTVFIPGLHSESQGYIDSFTGQKLAKNQITWFVRKGANISDDTRLPHSFFRRFRKVSPWSATLVTCKSSRAPTSLVHTQPGSGDGVEILCHLTADLSKVPKALFKKKRKFFRKYYEAEYEIAMVIAGGGLRFELVYLNMTYGSVGVQYVNDL